MKNIKPFGPVIGKTRISNNFIKKINNEFDLKIKNKNSDYSSKLASQIRNEIKLNSNFIKKNLAREILINAKQFLKMKK
jgi:hypothetical protein